MEDIINQRISGKRREEVNSFRPPPQSLASELLEEGLKVTYPAISLRMCAAEIREGNRVKTPCI